MKYRTIKFLWAGIAALLFGLGSCYGQTKKMLAAAVPVADTLKIVPAPADSIPIALRLRAYKQNVHASFYADKFNGRRTASGSKFNNNMYTAAHRKFPFGTKLKITNKENGKSVIVEVTDRGPFSKGREIDISRRAFQEICDNKSCGGLKVTIDVIVD